MAIQIGKYKRPGIFVEEIDQSVITSPTQTGISSLVIGFSKKGPVNTPIQITNTGDLEAIFGSLDRNLERKSSYFHRTISQMLQSSPVYAINLLSTDDTLDKIEYKSLSAATDKTNDENELGAYRKFFDTTGFWKRDSEQFINLTKSNPGYSERVLNFTNLSDRYISVFTFKSKLSGFNRTLIEWYGSQEKLPPYVYPNDYASDYLVDVVVVGGDWSNYDELSVDPRWSIYFSNTGLRKEQVRNFANDRNVTLLSYYEGLSLLPYFRDGNGRNIFIESVINQDTDKTGLYCAFNSDIFETDAPNGLVDLNGNNLVDSEKSSLEFLSYKETISEIQGYSKVVLDRPGNSFVIDYVTGVSPSSVYRSGTVSRTGYFSEGFVNGITRTSYSIGTVSVGTASSSNGKINVTYGLSEASIGGTPYAVIGGAKVPVSVTGSFTVNASDYTTDGTYSVAFVLESTGNISKVSNFNNSNLPTVTATDVVLGYTTFNVGTTQSVKTLTANPTFTHVTVATSSFIELTHGSDYGVTYSGTGSFILEFFSTSGTINSNNYTAYRKLKLFNAFSNILSSANKNKVVLVLDPSSKLKYPLTNTTITVNSSNLSNKSIKFDTTLSQSELDTVLKGFIAFYTVDDEFLIGTESLITKNQDISYGSATQGVVAKYSEFYSDFYNGVINTGDYFYSNIISDEYTVTFMTQSGTFSGDYIQFSGPVASGTFPDPSVVSAQQKIKIPSSTLNNNTFTIADSQNLGTASGIYRYEVAENINPESLSNVNIVYDIDSKNYLQMYLNSDGTLHVKFTDNTLDSQAIVDVSLNSDININTYKSNFKESVEIEIPSGYVESANKILVNASRYTELKVGDFLEAYISPENDPNDPDYNSDNGIPKRLTRILSKKAYAPDTTLVELATDAAIKKVSYGGDYQTTRYTQLEDYVNDYKAITLKGFRVRQASIPDGTEERQNAILNLVANGTPLFRAITNKEAFDFRYLVDSFGLGLTENSKQQLMDICGERLDALGILNMPSMKAFKNSTSPSFLDEDGVLSIEYVSQGGDPESNPAFLYSFGQGKGTTCVGYFAPYVTVNDNGRPLDVPPAMFVATTYFRKINSNVTSIVPWTIAAGVTNGKVTGIAGLEIDFTPQDIEFLNQASMNPIVFKRNRGFVIETENTSQTLYKSSLSYLHVREVLIELERELSRMLLDFQWKFNTPEVRAEIKLRADVICEKYVNKNGLYNYFNKCDDENNTGEVIDNQIGVLDTYVEVIKGMGIIVNNITILRTGAIQSGGFVSA